MIYLAETIAGDELFECVPESTLKEIVSEPARSTYLFTCGCVAVRDIDSVNCWIRWCAKHRESRPPLNTPLQQSREN